MTCVNAYSDEDMIGNAKFIIVVERLWGTWVDAGEGGNEYGGERDCLGVAWVEVAGLGQEDAQHHQGRPAELQPGRAPTQDELEEELLIKYLLIEITQL